MASEKFAVTGVAAAAPSGPTIVIEKLGLRFAGETLFDDLSLDLPGGEWTAVLGSSGIGKTSLLRAIAGATQATGRISTQAGAPLRGLIAYMGQDNSLFPWLSALGNVVVGARLRGTPADRPRAMRLLESVGLAGSGKMLPAALSGGMRQRVALARTLYEDRPVVLMDEPFSGLDQLSRSRMQTLAAELLRGRTVLLITHDPLEACRLADRVLVMSGLPASLSAPLVSDGPTPRRVDDPIVLRTQGSLMRTLVGLPE